MGHLPLSVLPFNCPPHLWREDMWQKKMTTFRTSLALNCLHSMQRLCSPCLQCSLFTHMWRVWPAGMRRKRCIFYYYRIKHLGGVEFFKTFSGMIFYGGHRAFPIPVLSINCKHFPQVLAQECMYSRKHLVSYPGPFPAIHNATHWNEAATYNV